LDEPGEDTSKYDIIMPTVVRPKNPDVIAMSPPFFDSTEVSTAQSVSARVRVRIRVWVRVCMVRDV